MAANGTVGHCLKRQLESTKRRSLIRRSDIERIAATHGISLVPEPSAESAESADHAEIPTEEGSAHLQDLQHLHVESEHIEDPANDDIDVQAVLLQDLLDAEGSAE